MSELLDAILVMILVVVPLNGWAFRKDRRRRRLADGSPDMGKEEVA